MFRVHPRRTPSFRITRTVAPLSDVIASVCCDLDATTLDSLDSSVDDQTWFNLIDTPSDGSAKADWDFHLGLTSGASTDDPAIENEGTAAGRLNTDGGDFLTLKTFANATTLANAHKQGGAYWIALAFQATVGSLLRPWGSASGTVSSDIGIKGQLDNASFRRTYHYDGTSQAQNGETTAANDWTIGDDILAIISMDMTADTNNIRIWTVSTTSQLLSLTRLSTTSASNGRFHIGATSDSGPNVLNIIPANTSFYHFSVGDEFLTDAKATDIATALTARHERSYLGQ